MRRTQIYITEAQERLIATRAADGGVSKAEVIRRILDAGLDLDDGSAARRRAIEATSGILPTAEGPSEWLARARGEGADGRLRGLGL